MSDLVKQLNDAIEALAGYPEVVAKPRTHEEYCQNMETLDRIAKMAGKALNLSDRLYEEFEAGEADFIQAQAETDEYRRDPEGYYGVSNQF